MIAAKFRQMENYSYPVSYPESGDSSPRSREIDFDHTTPWEDQQPPSSNYKVKFMCSYGGKINPRPHDNQLSYIGGETKILAVDRNIKFSALISKLLALCDAADVSFKYQLPGEDLDALISVTNDEDLEHMMHEYDRLFKASAKPARLRLFLFPVAAGGGGGGGGGGSFGSSEGKSDKERFVDALNSGPIQPTAVQAAAAAAPPSNNVDFFFGLEKGMIPPPLQQVATKVQGQVPVPDPEVHVLAPEDRVIGPDNPIQSQIPDLQRLQISTAQEQAVYRRRSDENLVEAFSGDYYAPKVSPPPVASNIPAAVTSAPSYWPEKQPAGGFYQATAPFPEQQQVYMIPTPTGMYHAPIGRPMTGPAGQGYYAVQRMPTEVYREHQSPVYNAVPPAPAAAQPTLPQQAPAKVAGFTTAAGGVGVVDAGYNAQVAYDGATGRQVYYAPQGVMPPQTYQAMAAAAAVNGDMRTAGGLSQEGKVIVKTSPAAV